jgi:adenylate cyclase class IV
MDIFPFPEGEFEDTKGAIRIRLSKKGRQHHVAIRKRRKKQK